MDYLKHKYEDYFDTIMANSETMDQVKTIEPCGDCCYWYMMGLCTCADTVTCKVCCQGEEVNGCLSCLNKLSCCIPSLILQIIPGCCLFYPCICSSICVGACQGKVGKNK